MKRMIIISAVSFGMIVWCSRNSNRFSTVKNIIPVTDKNVRFSYVHSTSVANGYEEVSIPHNYEHVFDLGRYPGVESHLFEHSEKNRLMAYKFPSADMAKQAADDQDCRGEYTGYSGNEECCSGKGNSCKLAIDNKGIIIIVCCD